MTPPQPRPAGRTAAEVVKPLPLSEPALALLTPELTVRQYLDVLIAVPLRVDALRVLALALPKPEAVWWGALCIQLAMPTPWKPSAEQAVEATETWVKSPTDENRRACALAAEAAGWDTAAGCLAGSAWLTGGSLSPPKLPPVSPREDLTGQMLASVMLLASVTDPKTAAEKQDRFIALGLQVAAGQIKKGEVPTNAKQFAD